MRVLILFSVSVAVCISTITAQQPTPRMVVVQPATTSAPASAAPATAATPSDAAVANAIKMLEQIKATNDTTLKKQEAMLQQLDELQKAAEQLKVFSKRV